jgi:para-nitrobenzyl esterase
LSQVFMNRRQVIGTGLSLSAALPLASYAFGQADSDAVEVTTANGPLRGKNEHGIVKFLGVPYAKPPVGQLRFKAPQPLEPWTEVRDAIAFGGTSIQPPDFDIGPDKRVPPVSEDCLYLNIWTPAADGRKRPVMIYNHGGGFTTGSGAREPQDGTNLAKQYDVVVVASNHRLGLLGYLFLGDIAPSGEFAANQGMLDIAAAIKWTSDNIENFGGDPGNIFVFGESGGGAKTAAIYAMPSAAPLYHKASVESAATLSFPTREGATARARETLKELGIAETEIDKIYDVPTDKLLEVQAKAGGGAPWAAVQPAVPGFGAFVDGEVITQNPFLDGAPAFSADKPLIVGSTRDETVFFSMYGPPDIFSLDEAGLKPALEKAMNPAFVDEAIATFKASRPDATPSQIYHAITTSPIAYGSALIAEQKVAQGAAPVYLYHLDYHSKVKIPGTDYEFGSPHASDIFLKFDNPLAFPDQIFAQDKTPERLQTAKNMSGLWASFAHNGKPGGVDGLIEWPAYNLETRPVMSIDSTLKIIEDPEPTERELAMKVFDAGRV